MLQDFNRKTRPILFLIFAVTVCVSTSFSQDIEINKGYCFNDLNFQTEMSSIGGEWEVAKYPEEGYSSYGLVDSENYYCSELFGVLFDQFTVYAHDNGINCELVK